MQRITLDFQLCYVNACLDGCSCDIIIDEQYLWKRYVYLANDLISLDDKSTIADLGM